ncbi:voltage-gated chloride channel family protein [Leptotrichia wadei]|uniref:Voltage-gated chloride channel family protein n=1 Tax=Leptotrichia wadei TaxID=157687 RepID=A0A510KA28_9FUSO|nr:chloride channel protein [Leptotrichia wadei]BBM48037.1 voltage-gated chloride channel family protein [Leptotrichia wadei]
MLKNIKESYQHSYFLYLKLIIAGIIIGFIVGIIDTIFGRGLIWIGDIRKEYLYYFVPFLALAGLLIVFIYQKFAGKTGKGMGLIFEVGHGTEKEIPLRLVPILTVATWITHLFGGSAGREGVAVQLGATFSHRFNKYFNFPDKSKVFLVTGMAAGFGGLFQTPIAALFFGLEVLALGNLQLYALLPAVVAAFTASWTSSFLGLEKFTHIVNTTLSITPTTFVKFAILGVIFGFAGNLFVYLQSFLKKFAAEKIKNPYYRIFIIGIFLSIILLLLHEGRYTGLGTNLIENSFLGKPIFGYDWILKLLLTTLTLAAGFQGGEVTPLFSIGASLGVVIGIFFGLPIEFVAAAGYISVFGSATNTLLAPIFIGGEVFGFNNLPFFVIIVIFAYLVNRKISTYGLQKNYFEEIE